MTELEDRAGSAEFPQLYLSMSVKYLPANLQTCELAQLRLVEPLMRPARISHPIAKPESH